MGIAVTTAVALYAAYVFNSPLHYLETTSENLKEVCARKIDVSCAPESHSPPLASAQVFYGREPWLVICSNGSAVDGVFEGRFLVLLGSPSIYALPMH